ncbi:hypothetical protein P148_SR1C00001G1090 [candidate division SR1 bacterium RAAC1_SR1_1]|nr:hypothetical protein P148_SR1C00001G1090 [candidate division SR1 bacterium RAAC1_SR1_1]
MKKTTEKDSLVSQIKAIPNQVKIFVLGLFVVVLALVSVLPNLNYKFLQGSILNIKTESKVNGYGYGYGYEPPYVFVDDDGYGYGYQVDENTKKYIRIRNIEFYFDNMSDILTVKVIYSPRYEGTMIVEPSIYLVEPAQINYGTTNPSYIGKCLVLENNDICIMKQQFTINRTLHGNQIKVTPVFKTRVTAVSNNDQRALGQIIIDNASTNTTCQTPENILACSLHLTSCPSECRPAQCQTPENVLACSLGLDSCPQECIYNGNTTLTGNVCQTPENVLACSLHLASCPQECRPAQCQIPENVLACSLGLDSCPQECIYGATSGNTTSYWTNWLNRDGPSGNGDYETYADFMPVPCKDGYQPIDVKFIRADESETTQTIHFSSKGGYCLNSENSKGCADYKVKFFCEKTGSKPTIIEKPKETPRVIEQPKVVETPIVIEKPRTVKEAITIEAKPTPKTKETIETKTTAESTILDIFKDLLK